MSKEEKNIPEIRFEEFEGEWKNARFANIGTIAMNKRIYAEQTSPRGDIPFYKIGTFGKKPDAFISRELFDTYKKAFPYPEKGDILISASGTIGRTVRYDGEDAYYQDSNIIWLRHDNDKVINDFLKHYYSVVNWHGIEGSTIKRLYNDNFLKTQIIYPTIKEQEKISELLNIIEKKINNKATKIKMSNQYKQAMLQKMFPKEGEKEPEIRFEGFEGEWVETKIEKIAGQTYGGGTPSTSVSEYWDGQIPWIQSSDVKENKVLGTSPNKFITNKGIAESATKLIPENSVSLVTRVGVGKVAYMPFPYTTSQDFLNLSDLKTNAIFTTYLLTLKMKENINNTQGSAIKGVTSKEVLNQKITIPKESSEQQQIGLFFSEIDSNINSKELELKKLNQYKQAMLDKMFV